MARNGSGTYSLPVPPFVPGTVISSADVNLDFSDIATALTGSIAADGQTSITGQLRGAQASDPTYSIAGDLNTGFGSSTADTAYIQCGGTNIVSCTTSGTTFVGNATLTNGTLSARSTSGAAVVEAFKNAATAVDDVVAGYDFYGLDSASNKQKYAAIYAQAKDPTSGTEDGWLFLDVVIAGVQSNRMIVGDTTVLFTGGIFTSASVQATTGFIGGTFSGTTGTFSGALSGATATGAMIATQAQQETGSATDVLVTPGRQQFHQSAAKAWGFFTVSGSVLTVNTGQCYNVSGIVRNTTGSYTISFSTSFSNSTYTFVPAVSSCVLGSYTRANGNVNFTTVVPENIGTARDVTLCHFVCYGDQ